MNEHLEAILDYNPSTNLYKDEKDNAASFKKAVLENTLKDIPTAHKTKPKIICVGGNKGSEVFELSNQFRKVTKLYPKLPGNIAFYGAAKVNNFIYCIGGTENKPGPAQVFRMNPKEVTLEWEKVASLNSFIIFDWAIFNEKLVVTGGNNQELDATEVYDEQSKKWRKLSSMNETRYGNTLVSCKGCLYAIGGKGRSSVERLSK